MGRKELHNSDSKRRAEINFRSQLRGDRDKHEPFSPQQATVASVLESGKKAFARKTKKRQLKGLEQTIDTARALQLNYLLNEQILDISEKNLPIEVAAALQANWQQIRSRVAELKRQAKNIAVESKSTPKNEAELAALMRRYLLEELKKPFTSFAELFDRVLYAMPKGVYAGLTLIVILGAMQLACGLSAPKADVDPNQASAPNFPGEVDPSLTPPPPQEDPIVTAEAPTQPPSPTVEVVVLSEAEIIQKLVDEAMEGGSVDVSSLSFEQRKTFSIALDKEKDARRGSNPIIFTDRNGDKFYIDPVTLDFKPVSDGTSAEQRTIDNTLPRVVDNEGYTHVFYKGSWIRIEGSQNIMFGNFDNFPWPAGEKVDPQWVTDPNLQGLTNPEYLHKAYGKQVNMVPTFFLGKEIGEINIPGFGVAGTLMGFVINESDPFSVTTVLITGAPNLYGDNFKAANLGKIREISDFYKALKINRLYYVMYEVDQKAEFAQSYPKSDGKEPTTDYEGLAPSSQTHNVITGNQVNNKLPLLEAKVLVLEAGN